MINERYIPEFRVRIGGAAIPAALRASITSLSYQTGFEGADRVELALANQDLRWLDHPELALGRQLSLDMGYAPDQIERMFVGEIVGQNASFPSGGAPALTIVAQDRRQHMQEGTKVRWFAIPGQSSNRPLPDAAIVGIVSAENRLIPIMDPISATVSVLIGKAEAVAATTDPDLARVIIRKQMGESDFQFLKRIARENGWEMLIDQSGPLGGYQLRFLSPHEQREPVLTLAYGHSLIDFTPRISEVGQIAAVSVPIWVPDIKTEFTITVTWNWDRQSLDLSIVPSFGAAAETNVLPEVFQAIARSAKTPEQAEAARQMAESAAQDQMSPKEKPGVMLVGESVTAATAPRAILSRLIPRLNQRLTGSGNTIGDPRIRAGVVLQLEGMGRQFSGPYRVTSATHTLDSGGYRTSFEVRREIWLGDLPTPGSLTPTVFGQRLR